jgi:catechol 2,3-dioxygenase-like lactoylglutathione lyase family enzyme
MEVYGLQHIGLTVPNMAQAVAFFEDVFGAVTLFGTGRLEVDDAFMVRKLGVPAHTRIKDIKVLRCGVGTNLELFEYEGDDGTPIKRNSDVGGFHLALQVDDAYAAANRLREQGIEVLDGPTYVDSGPMKGLDWVYFKTPWGQFMELVSMTHGPLGYEADSPVKAWSPV